MPYKLKIVGPRQLDYIAYEETPLLENEVRAEAVLSGISHGTEMNLYRGTSPFSSKRFDPDLRLFLPSAEPDPAFQLGYEWVGRVVETGARIEHLKPGDLVHLLYPHAETHTFVPFDMPYKGILQALPSHMKPEQAIFIALAGVALQAVHDARMKVGDRVAVFGLGVIGQFIVQLARLNGAAWIDAIDPIPMRRRITLADGADRVLDPTACDVGYEIKAASPHRGADVAIEASGRYDALHQAIRSVRKAGQVVTVGFYQGGAEALRLGEEWHHNRVTMVSSMAVWECPHRDYPLWDRQRIDDVVIDLLASGRLRSEHLITHRFPFKHAAEAYEYIDAHPTDVVKVALTY